MMPAIASMPLFGPDRGKAPIRRPLPRRSPPRPRCPSRPASARTVSGRYRPGGPSPPAPPPGRCPRAGSSEIMVARCAPGRRDTPRPAHRDHAPARWLAARSSRSPGWGLGGQALRGRPCLSLRDIPDELASAPVTASRACSAAARVGVSRHAGAGRDSRRTRPSAAVLRKSSMSPVTSSGSSEMGTWLRP